MFMLLKFSINILLNEFFAQLATRTHFIYSIKWLPSNKNSKILQSGCPRDKYIIIYIKLFIFTVLNEFFAQLATRTHFIYSV